ncbi:hypothetical protein HK098_001500 [Nowakowskiella sp. JEL0407]|nr:hypothetical protein HK098_001500 [Nowakowskiella sp. JEL0407]
MNKSASALDMFKAEKCGLEVIQQAVPGFAPKSLLVGSLPFGGAYIVMERLHMGRIRSHQGQRELGAKIAKMHQYVSPNGKYGFEINNTIGWTPQENTWEEDWGIFYRERRMKPMIAFVLKRNPNDKELERLGAILCDNIEKFFGEGLDLKPRILHGDLWSGNHGFDTDKTEFVIFDPACYFGHHETDIAMMKMFGGYSEGKISNDRKELSLSGYFQSVLTNITKLFQSNPVLKCEWTCINSTTTWNQVLMKFLGIRHPTLLRIAALLLTLLFYFTLKSNNTGSILAPELDRWTINFSPSTHKISTFETGYENVETASTVADYIADTYREQSFFCKLLPALRKSTKPRIKRISSLQHVNAGFDMVLHESGDIVSDFIYTHGYWEALLTNAMFVKMEEVSKFTGKKAVFMDVGANVGWHALAMAGAGYPVVAFEPMPQNLMLIRWSLCLNSTMKMEVYSKGLGDKRQDCKIISPDHNFGNGNVLCKQEGKFPEIQRGYFERARISVDRLDDLLGDRFSTHNPNHEQIGILKIDVEGFELNAFRGGIKFLKAAKIPYLAVEVGPELSGIQEAIDFLELLDDLGYEVRVNGRVGGTWDDSKVLRRKDATSFIHSVVLLAQVDIVCVRKDWIRQHPHTAGKMGIWEPVYTLPGS